MSEATIDTVAVSNTGGPQIPGTGAQLPPPNTQGVPAQEAAATAAPATPTATPTLDVEALKAALNPGGDTGSAPAQVLEETGNPSIDAGVAMLKQVSGLTDADMVRALGKAIEYQDPNLIDSAFIKERFGEHAAYAELLAKAYLDDQVGQATKAVKAAYDVVGGEENWRVASQLFSSRAPEPMRAAARALANSGELVKAAQLVASFCQEAGLIRTENPLVRGAAVSQTLSATEFKAEYTKLRQEAGNRSLESKQFQSRYNDLLQRREAGRRAGL